MNLFLFGAGASYGSQADGPPMGSQLFEALRQFNPTGWGQLPADMADLFRGDFERGMARVAETNSHAMPILQRAMAAFFFRFVPRMSSLFVRLAQRIHRHQWNGAIATLNYERLLELSLLQVGVQPIVGQGAGEGQIELCLPHGCCHLFCEGIQASPAGVSFSGVGVTFDGPVVAISDPEEFQRRINGNAVPPVMSYFELQKKTSAGVSFINSQRARWAELASQANKIAIVGVKVRPRDSHIWLPIANSAARVVYCAGAAAGNEFRGWAAASRPGKGDRVLEGYFAEEFSSLCYEMGLA